jgi:uncharacterized membrane-anchored protein
MAFLSVAAPAYLCRANARGVRAGVAIDRQHSATKVPEVTLGFWIIKILATTLGETGGDTFSMTMDLGYLLSSAIFVSILVLLVVMQIAAKKFHPFL